MFDTFFHDVKYAARSLRRAPGFAAAALATIALGIGATTAIFSVVNGVLLRPLPYGDPDRIVSVWNAWDDTPRGDLSPAEYFDYLDRVDAFERFGVYTGAFATLTGAGEPVRLPAGFLSHGVLPALGVQPQIGRLFAPDDDTPGNTVVLLSDGLWRRTFGGAADIVGRRIVLNNRTRTIVGVLPAGFRLPADFGAPDAAQVFIPLGLDRQNLPGRGSHFLNGVARLEPDVSHERVAARIRQVAEAFPAEFPTEYPIAMRFTAGITPVHEDIVGDVRPVLMTLLGAIGFVLLIACGNIAHLFLSRGERRREEFGIRAALGAGRLRLIRQTLVESGLVAILGGAAGMLLALAATRALVALSPPELPRLDAVTVDATVLGFGLAASALVGLLVGLAPALRAVHGLQPSGGDSRSVAGASPSRLRLRRALIGSEVAVAIVLTFGAGLAVKSLLRLLSVDPGYRTANVLTASVSLPPTTYADGGKTATFFATLLDRLRQQPGVVEAGAVSGLPLTQPLGDLNFQIEGRETAPGQRSRRADWQVVTDGYFDAIGMRVLHGRGIKPSDRVNTPGVVVLNEAAAALHWPNGDALGKRMRLGGGAGPGWVTVVGIVNNVRQASLRAEPKPEMYLAHSQFRFWGGGNEPVRTLTVVARAAGDAAPIAQALRREVAAVDPSLPVDAVRTMASIRGESVSSLQFVSLLLSAFAGVALVVTLVGVYGVMAFAVAQRRREIGVRVALGAAPAAVVRLILRQGLTPAAFGIAAGVAGGMLLSRVLEAQLYEVTPNDAATAVAVSLLVAAVAVLACGIPAMRAARVDPIAALRAD